MFGFNKGKPYCRLCCGFNGKKAIISKNIKPKLVVPRLDYSLSDKQASLSKKAAIEDKEIYIDAVCGSGKTEIVFRSIALVISKGKRVGFAIPRREVVKEIYERLKQVFPTLNIVCVYGGHNEYLDGDIVCLTCHQCYRYKNKFGLLIIDEYDAFPLKGNEALLKITKSTAQSKIIYLSATFSKEELLNKKHLSLQRRYHNYDLPVPNLYINNKIISFLKLYLFIINQKHMVFVFAPTIAEAKNLYMHLKPLIISTILFTSQSKDKDKLYSLIKSNKVKVVVATTILERGITIKGLNVCVFNASHPLFNSQTLIQISGRAGRKKDCPKGIVNFYAFTPSNNCEKAIKEIMQKNNFISYE